MRTPTLGTGEISPILHSRQAASNTIRASGRFRAGSERSAKSEVQLRAALSVLALVGVIAACSPEMQELPEETIFDRPSLSSSESRELVRILNSYRNDWLTHWATSPSSSGADAIIEVSSPPEFHSIFYYYSNLDQGRCSMFGTGHQFEGHQAFPPSICRRLDAMLIAGSGQGRV